VLHEFHDYCRHADMVVACAQSGASRERARHATRRLKTQILYPLVSSKETASPACQHEGTEPSIGLSLDEPEYSKSR
jgi:hypothetical protein